MAENFDLNKLGEIQGLSEKRATQRLMEEGYNEIPSVKKRSLFKITLSVIREPTLLIKYQKKLVPLSVY